MSEKLLDTNTKIPKDAQYYSFGRYYKKWNGRDTVFVWECDDWETISPEGGTESICRDINLGDGNYIYQMSNGDTLEVCIKPKKNKKGHVVRSVHGNSDMRDFYSSITNCYFGDASKVLDFAGSARKNAAGEIQDCCYGVFIDDFKEASRKIENDANENQDHFFKFLVTRKN